METDTGQSTDSFLLSLRQTLSRFNWRRRTIDSPTRSSRHTERKKESQVAEKFNLDVRSRTKNLISLRGSLSFSCFFSLSSISVTLLSFSLFPSSLPFSPLHALAPSSQSPARGLFDTHFTGIASGGYNLFPFVSPISSQRDVVQFCNAAFDVVCQLLSVFLLLLLRSLSRSIAIQMARSGHYVTWECE